MNAKVNFIYEKRVIEIQCKPEDDLTTIYQRFLNKLNPNLTQENFDFFYEGNKLDKGLKNLNEIIFQNKKEITISVEKKSNIIKCPQCMCNDCIIDIEDYVINFYGCKYNHTDYKIIDDYQDTQKINFSKLICHKDGCGKNQSNDPEDFYKCLTCGQILNHTQYYCSVHSREHDKNNDNKHIQVKYDQKNYYCTRHYKNYIKYCFKCSKNLCEDCSEDHKDHQIKDYISMAPNINEFENSLKEIKQKIEDLKYIIDYIKHHILDGTVKIYENYCEILNDVIEKYKLNNKEFKNYAILKTFFNLKKSNKAIIDDLDKIIKEDSYKDKIDSLMLMFQKKWDNYKNLNNNVNNIYAKKIADGLDDFLEWEGKIPIEKTKNDESHSDKKESTLDTKRNTHKSFNKYKKHKK